MAVSSKTRLSTERAAQLYIQAHRDAHYTNLPAAHKQAKLDILRQLEHQDPQVRERALIGGPRHTGQLSPSERSHQTYMREQAGISHAELLERRRALDQPPRVPSRGPQPRPAPSRPSLPPARPAARRAARAVARATPGVTGGKNTVIRVIGVIVALSVLYLIVSKRGSGAFAALTGITTGVFRNFLGSGDLLANPLGSTSTSTPAATPSAATTAQVAAESSNVVGSIAANNPLGPLPTVPAVAVPSSSANLGRPARPAAKS